MPGDLDATVLAEYPEWLAGSLGRATRGTEKARQLGTYGYPIRETEP